MAGPSYLDYVLEQLARFPGAASRRMFGGAGLFKRGIMFGLIARDELYFKVGPKTLDEYRARKSTPFEYQARGRTVGLSSYWRVPEDVIEDREEFAAWAAKAYASALVARKAAPAKPRRKARAKSPRR